MERIGDPNRIKKALADFGETAPNWPFREEKVYWDRMAGILKREVVDPIALVSRVAMPDVVIGFDRASKANTLAYYHTVPNAHGIPDEVIFNKTHYEERDGKMVWRYGIWSQAETLTHEMIHGLLNFISKLEDRKIPAHGAEFVTTCKKVGLNVVPGVGAHYQVADADSSFARVMRSMGIPRPQDVPRDEGEPLPKRDYFRPKKEKGSSTLHKWECPSCGLKVRIGINDDPQLIHKPCGEVLIYKA